MVVDMDLVDLRHSDDNPCTKLGKNFIPLYDLTVICMSRYKVFLLHMFLLLSFSVTAEERSLEKAREIAYDFMTSGVQTKSSVIDLRMVYDGENHATRAAEAAPAYYVFNNEAGPGFVIVSGDDVAMPILGYSDSFNFDVVGMPANLRWWLGAMRSQIEAARNSGVMSSRAAADVGTEVIRYETALWDQGEPYYNACPMDGYSRTYTGCGPTAIAIAMRYRQWPDAGVGTIPSYTTESERIKVAARALGEKYDWRQMPMSDGYYASWTSAQKSQVARLMADIGAATKADYTVEGTGIWDEDVPPAMVKYFGYDDDMYVAFRQNLDTGRDQYTTSQWYSLVKEELKNGPAVYAGSDYEGSMGHMFILAGYTTKNYFYLNWGWGGMANGYYTLEALTPEEQGTGANDMGSYHDWVSLMVNFKKSETGTTPDPGTDPDPEPDTEASIEETTTLKYDHASHSLTLVVKDGVEVRFSSRSGKNIGVERNSDGTYKLSTAGLAAGDYYIDLTKGTDSKRLIVNL